jgi:competence protein ComEC
VSAFILLVFNPFFITDVGFQLSYFALAGLIYFQPGIASCWQPGHFILNSIWQSIAASVAATISTLPLTLLYFKQFAVWFFLCNLVVVPATFVILLLALLVVIHIPVVALLVNFLIDFLIQFINFFNSDVYGFVDMIDFTFWDALILSAFIVLVSITIQYRTYKGAVFSMFLLICWQSLSIVLSYSAKKSELFTCYALQKKNLFSVKCGSQTLISENDSLNFSFHVKPHLISFNHPAIKITPFNFVMNKHNSILILNKTNFWPKEHFKEVKTLVLCNNFKLTAKDLHQFNGLKSIVCASSNNNFTIKKTQELSRKFAIDFYNVKQKGAYLFKFD